jgi:RNA polymerase sigma factor (sigma-70 family)
MNNCVRGEKRWQRRHVLEEPEALSRLLEAQAAAEDETDGGAFAEYLQDAPLREQVGDPVLAAALTHLPEATQDVLTLAYVHDLTDAEIAARLGRSVAAVKKQRQRALQGLREILQRSDMGKEEPASS